jgi:uncharacterized membrane protein YhhN
MNKALVALAVMAPIIYLFFANTLPYPGDVIVKTSMCVALALLAWRHKSLLLAGALFFSAVGDALLAIDGAKLFVPALASFLITHVVYAVIFVKLARADPISTTFVRKAGMLLAILFAVAYAIVLWPHLGSLAVPVLFYITAIVTMTVLSFRVRQAIVPFGAVLFMASDSLIALGKFLWQSPWLGPSVWITYALAQLFIAYGLLNAKHRRGT